MGKTTANAVYYLKTSLAFIYDAKLQVSKFGHALKAQFQGIVLSPFPSSFFLAFWCFECEPFVRIFSYSISLHDGKPFNSLNKTKSLNFSWNLFCNGKPKLWKACKNVKIALCVRVQRIRGARQISWRLSSSSIRNVTHIYQGDHQSGRRGGGGRGALNQCLIPSTVVNARSLKYE